MDADLPVHQWYRFVLSFPPHLVRHYLDKFGVKPGQVVLDPFCGTGTTLVECKKRRIRSIGLEPNPVAHFASAVKTSWDVDTDGLLEHARTVAKQAEAMIQQDRAVAQCGEPSSSEPATLNPTLLRLPDTQAKLLIRGSISPLPLHKTLRLLAAMEDQRHPVYTNYERLALAKALVNGIGNLRFGPEVGVTRPKHDAPVLDCWMSNVSSMASDLASVSERRLIPSAILNADSRAIHQTVADESVDAVITSPPYPNEKDYTRTTRLESVLLGFLNDRRDLQALKRSLVKSNTRGVYKDDDDDRIVSEIPRIRALADNIEQERIRLGKTSGFERLYARVTKLYFGGMTRHLSELRHALKPDARLAYVVGDQASYLRVMIRTGEQLADIADALGYEVIERDLFRRRFSTATKQHLREEVLVLRWPGWGRS